MRNFTRAELRDLSKTLTAALDSKTDDPLALIEAARDAVESALNDRPVRIYALQLIAEGRHRNDYEPVGTAILNHVSYVDPYSDPVVTAAFNEARHTPGFAAFLASELDGRMHDDGFGDWEEMTTPALAEAAFGQYMAAVVQVEVEQQLFYLNNA